MGRRRLGLVHVLAVLAVARPECTRSCPDGFFSCTCEWDWQECPPPPSCSSTPVITPGADSGMVVVEFPDGAVRDEEPAGGSLALVATPRGLYLVAALPELDVVRVVRVDTPLRAVLMGDVPFAPGAEPTRVVADDAQGTAHVLVTGTHELVTLDPETLAVVARARICDTARSLGIDPAGGVAVACESGDLVTYDATTGDEKRRLFVDRGLEDLAIGRDVLVTTTREHLFMLGVDGTLVKQDRGAQAIVAFDAANIVVASSGGLELTAFDGGARSIGGALPRITDLSMAEDGTIAVAADGKAFILPSGATALSSLAMPGYVTAVAVSQGLFGAHTTEATLVVARLDEVREEVVVE